MYKSGFLKDKLVEQGEKRKRERKGGVKKPEGGEMQEHSLFGGKSGKKKGAAGEEGINEDVQELIDELKNDLKIRDQEYEELKAHLRYNLYLILPKPLRANKKKYKRNLIFRTLKFFETNLK
jgi:hypothetical protein